LINNPSFDRWASNAWQGRVAHNRLPNVEHQTVDLNHLELADGSLDAIFLVKVYHDLYWVDTDKKNWPTVDTPAVLDKLVKTLKPGAPWSSWIIRRSPAPHHCRIVAASDRRGVRAARFRITCLKLVGKSDALRMPDDPRTQVSYKAPILVKPTASC